MMVKSNESIPRLAWVLLGGIGLACTPSQEPVQEGRTNAVMADSDSEVVGKQSQDLDKYQHLRRLSLDLRGYIPSYEEYLALDDLEEVPQSTIDSWIGSDAYRLAMRDYHEALLWPNPSGAVITDSNALLKTTRVEDGDETLTIYVLPGNRRQKAYRGDPEATCGPWLQQDYIEGVPVAEEVRDPSTGELLFLQEGYEIHRPYWSPDTDVKVCAFGAQSTAIGATGVACDSQDAFSDRSCGCGPDLRWCMVKGLDTVLWQDMREQFGLSVDAVTVGGDAYSSLVKNGEHYMNGRLAYWKKYQAQMVGLNRTYNIQGPGDASIPDSISFQDETWTAYTRTDLHAGVTTLPAFSLRFQTDRARANRLRIAFTGQYFIPPSQPENPEVDDCDAVNGDITQVCTCRGCHQVLEPMAAHFADVIDAGSTLTTDIPLYEPECDPNNYDNPERQIPKACARVYAVNLDDKNPGWRLTHQYAYMELEGFDNEGLGDAMHRSIFDHIESGPLGFVEGMIGSGQLANTTVKNLFKFLMGREMNLDISDPQNEVDLLTELADAFRTEDDIQALTTALVALPQYRRVQ